MAQTVLAIRQFSPIVANSENHQPFATGMYQNSTYSNLNPAAVTFVGAGHLRGGANGGNRAGRNIVQEWNTYFGNNTKLANWQKLCRDLDLGGRELGSIVKCKKALVGTYVNIWDLLDAVNDDKLPPRKFASAGKLAEYTRNHRKYFPLAQAKAGGPVRALLIHIY